MKVKGGGPCSFGLRRPADVAQRKLQAASLRFGSTLTLRPVVRPSSAAQVGTLVRRLIEVKEATGTGEAEVRRPSSATKLAEGQDKAFEKGFAASLVAEVKVEKKRPVVEKTSSHIGQLVGRRRVAHLAAAAQARNPSPPLGRLRRGSSAPNLRPAPPAKSAGAEIFEEIMRTDDFYGPILKEIKASYTAGDQRVVSPTPAELAVDAIRRPWIEEGGDTERAGCRAPPEKVRLLEQENLALRELLRRSYLHLKKPVSASEALSEQAPRSVAQGHGLSPAPKKAPELSVWSSPEPLAAAMLRTPPDRPCSVPVLNLADVEDQSYYDEEEEEEEDDYYEDYPLHNPDYGP